MTRQAAIRDGIRYSHVVRLEGNYKMRDDSDNAIEFTGIPDTEMGNITDFPPD